MLEPPRRYAEGAEHRRNASQCENLIEKPPAVGGTTAASRRFRFEDYERRAVAPEQTARPNAYGQVRLRMAVAQSRVSGDHVFAFQSFHVHHYSYRQLIRYLEDRLHNLQPAQPSGSTGYRAIVARLTPPTIIRRPRACSVFTFSPKNREANNGTSTNVSAIRG